MADQYAARRSKLFAKYDGLHDLYLQGGVVFAYVETGIATGESCRVQIPALPS